MADDKKSEKAEKPKKKRGRQKGGYALIEMKADGSPGRHFEIVVSDLDSQNDAKAYLKTQIEKGEVKADGSRTFGVIQIKTLSLTPKVETKVSVTW